MAGFKTHITVSSAMGVAYAGVAAGVYNVPIPTCILAGGLCGVSGMLPDLDSGPGKPLRESLAFAAAVVPMMMFDRARHMGLSPETMALAGGAIYLTIRFGIGWALRKYTVHRGMFHSIPAAIIATEIAFLVCASNSAAMRFYKAGAVFLGFMSHLILDEIWSVQMKGGRVQLKSSFGSAVKFVGKGVWPNVSTYGKLAILTVLVLTDPLFGELSPEGQQLHGYATSILDYFKKSTSVQIEDLAPAEQSSVEFVADSRAEEGSAPRRLLRTPGGGANNEEGDASELGAAPLEQPLSPPRTFQGLTPR